MNVRFFLFRFFHEPGYALRSGYFRGPFFRFLIYLENEEYETRPAILHVWQSCVYGNESIVHMIPTVFVRQIPWHHSYASSAARAKTERKIRRVQRAEHMKFLLFCIRNHKRLVPELWRQIVHIKKPAYHFDMRAVFYVRHTLIWLRMSVSRIFSEYLKMVGVSSKGWSLLW